MGVIRNKAQSHFTSLPNETLRDSTLSWAARGLLSAMLSYPPDWEFNVTHLLTLATDGKHATRSAMKELIERGYVTRQRAQGGWDYDVFDVPQGESSQVRKSDMWKSHMWKSATTKTEGSTKTEEETNAPSESGLFTEGKKLGKREWVAVVDSFRQLWNENRGTLPSVNRMTGAREKKVMALVKELGLDEALRLFELAVRVVAADEFWQKKGYGIDNLMRDGRVVEKAEAAPEERRVEPPIVGAIVAFKDVSSPRQPIVRGRVLEVSDHQVVVMVEDVDRRTGTERRVSLNQVVANA